MLDRLPSLTATAAYDGRTATARVQGPGAVSLGPLSLEVWEEQGGWAWALANAGDSPVAVTAVALRWEAGAAEPGARRVLRHGYQSWSPTAVARLGADRDPSLVEGARSLLRGMHHADAEPVRDPFELRSELVTVLDVPPATAGGPLLCVGFDGGARHDGTVRVRLGGGRVAVTAEAHLGGARMAPGERRPLHGVRVDGGDDPSELLEAWAARAGSAGAARVHAPYTVGWCSWYHWFHGITEDALRANLALADTWPFDVFQLDDGYQAAIGDWLRPNERFPTPLDRLAADVARAGRVPGIWIAPFLVSPESEVARRHPDWVATWQDGSPLVGMVNDGWGGRVHVLDTTRPDVLEHVAGVARALVQAGWRYLKLDFTYAPSLPGRYADAARTPAERVRAGMEAVRRGAGDETFLLGCGLALGAGIGVVDGMRIGPDVAPWWSRRGSGPYADAEPATRNAWRNTLARAFQHRRLWLNDPDCLMLRTTRTELDADAVRAWALAVGTSGGMAIVSDDLALLDGDARRLLDDVLDLGRAADDDARAGRPPRCPDLLDADPPTRLASAGRVLTGDPDAAHPSANVR